MTVPTGTFYGDGPGGVTIGFHPIKSGCIDEVVGIQALDTGWSTGMNFQIRGYVYSRTSANSVYFVRDTALDFGLDTIGSFAAQFLPFLAPLDSGYRFPFKFENVDSPFRMQQADLFCDGGSVLFGFAPTQSGTYIDTVLFLTGPNYSDTSRVILKGVASALSVEADSRKVPAAIFPNPSNGITQLQFSSESSRWRYVVYDMLGQEVLQRSGLRVSKNASLKLDTEGIPAGVYTLLLETDGGFSAQKMMIIR